MRPVTYTYEIRLDGSVFNLNNYFICKEGNVIYIHIYCYRN
jgi:hypothetical protein